MLKTKLLLLIFVVFAEALLLAKPLAIASNNPMINALERLKLICEKAKRNSESKINSFYCNNRDSIEKKYRDSIEKKYCLGTLNAKLTQFLCEPVIIELNSLVTSDCYFKPSVLKVDITNITWKSAEKWKYIVRLRFNTLLNKIKGKYETSIKNMYSSKNTSINVTPEKEYSYMLKRYKLSEKSDEDSIAIKCKGIREYIFDIYKLNHSFGRIDHSEIFSEESDFVTSYPGNFEAASKECRYSVWNENGKIIVNCRKHGDFILEGKGSK